MLKPNGPVNAFSNELVSLKFFYLIAYVEIFQYFNTKLSGLQINVNFLLIEDTKCKSRHKNLSQLFRDQMPNLSEVMATGFRFPLQQQMFL